MKRAREEEEADGNGAAPAAASVKRDMAPPPVKSEPASGERGVD